MTSQRQKKEPAEAGSPTLEDVRRKSLRQLHPTAGLYSCSEYNTSFIYIKTDHFWLIIQLTDVNFWRHPPEQIPEIRACQLVFHLAPMIRMGFGRNPVRKFGPAPASLRYAGASEPSRTA